MKRTQIMGILNLTPDSFSDGGEHFDSPLKAVKRVNAMIEAGADIVDIGGESTRPGAQPVPPQEQLQRVIPTLQEIRSRLGDAPVLSIDTNQARVAEEALRHGVNMVNSLGGTVLDREMASVVRRHQCPLILYHFKGAGATQPSQTEGGDVVGDVKRFFLNQIRYCEGQGIPRDRLILDPGIGFGKTLEQSLSILRRLRELQTFQLPILLGLSRKGFLGRLLQSGLDLDSPPPVQERLAAALAATAIGVQHGASIIRTHDVLETRRFLTALEVLSDG